MLRRMMLAKLHRATITRCDADYVGSITVDADLLRAAGMRPNEHVQVLDLDNAVRFETYIIKGKPGSGAIEVNGAAAKLVSPGHKVIIISYAMLDNAPDTLDAHAATVVLVNDDNTPGQTLHYPSTLD